MTKKSKLVFEPGALYVLKGLSKNKRHSSMTLYNGQLYLSDGGRWNNDAPHYTDGALFVSLSSVEPYDAAQCLAECREWVEQSYADRMDERNKEAVAKRQSRRQKQKWAKTTWVRLLAPDGTLVTMRLHGNMGKFKKVTNRTKVK